jgi:hypothetical protein
MKRLIIVFSLFTVSAGAYAQLKVDANGRSLFGSKPLSHGLFIADEFTGNNPTSFSIRRASNNFVFLERNIPAINLAISPWGTMRIGTGESFFQSYNVMPLTTLTIDNHLGVGGHTVALQVNMRHYTAEGIRISYDDYSYPDYPLLATYGLNCAACDDWAAFPEWTFPTYEEFSVYAGGYVYANGLLLSSDISLKKNVATISGALGKVRQLRGVTFDLNRTKTVREEVNDTALHISPDVRKQMKEETSRKRVGVVAQEVESVMPELVRTKRDGTKAVYYSEMVGLLIEAIKEQQEQIEELQSQVAYLTTEKQIAASFDAGLSANQSTLALPPQLFQNTPNPFNQSTEIGFYIPQKTQTATLYIYNMNGVQQRNITITERGKSAITIQASSLKAGIYFYTLICDGKPVDTKQMILTE